MLLDHFIMYMFRGFEKSTQVILPGRGYWISENFSYQSGDAWLFSIRLGLCCVSLNFFSSSSAILFPLNDYFISEAKVHSCNHFHLIVQCFRIILLEYKKKGVGETTKQLKLSCYFVIPEENQCVLFMERASLRISRST